MNVMYVALPFAVGIGVVFMCMAEKLQVGNIVPAVYLGGATYFAMMGIPEVAAKGYAVVAL